MAQGLQTKQLLFPSALAPVYLQPDLQGLGSTERTHVPCSLLAKDFSVSQVGSAFSLRTIPCPPATSRALVKAHQLGPRGDPLQQEVTAV